MKSDDLVGRVKTYEAIIKGENIPKAGTPESFKVLVKELQSLGLDVKVLDENENEIELKENLDYSTPGSNLRDDMEGSNRGGYDAEREFKASGASIQTFDEESEELVDADEEPDEEDLEAAMDENFDEDEF